MNVLAFTNLYPSPREPMRGLFNLYTFQALSELCSVRVVAPVPAWRRIRHPADVLRSVEDSRAGIPATYPTYWAVPRVAPEWNAGAVYRSVRRHVAQVRQTFPFDAIVGLFAYPDVAAASRLAIDAGVPLVAAVLGSDINELAELPALRGPIREALLHASSVVAVSKGLRDKVEALGIPADRITVQHNGVDGQRFVVRDRVAARRQLGIAEHGPHICFVGNLVAEKGPDVLIEAFGGSDRGALKDARVTFVGDGSLREPLIARATALGISDRVSFVGRRPPDEVALRISAADVLCLSSRREGCPNVVLEALASGRPVVATAVGGVPELVTDANGLMVPPDDPLALAAALAAALQRVWDPELLRATVPSLSWGDMARTLHQAVARAFHEKAR